MLKSVKVPIELCAYAARHNKENQQRLFLAMKLLCDDGKLKLNRQNKITLALALGYKSTKPLNQLIEDLIQDKWIRRNEKTGYYLILGFDKLANIKFYNCSSAIECNLKDLNSIWAFNGAALFTYLYRTQKGRINKAKTSERKKARSFHGQSNSPSFVFLPIALSGVNQIFGVTMTKIHLMKNEAVKHGYIEVKHNITILSRFKAIGKQFKAYKMEDKQIHGKTRIYIQDTDTIFTSIPLKRRRKYKTF